MIYFPHPSHFNFSFSETQSSIKNMEISCQQDLTIITGYTWRDPNKGSWQILQPWHNSSAKIYHVKKWQHGIPSKCCYHWKKKKKKKKALSSNFCSTLVHSVEIHCIIPHINLHTNYNDKTVCLALTCSLKRANTTHTTCNISSSSLCVCKPHNYTIIIHISSTEDYY